ncbi:MAG: hypothetical protein HYZ20_14460 [Burkholderiales bacterium]|nr:hypothetical protein [Burkholderiales bacterium]
MSMRDPSDSYAAAREMRSRDLGQYMMTLSDRLEDMERELRFRSTESLGSRPKFTTEEQAEYDRLDAEFSRVSKELGSLTGQ